MCIAININVNRVLTLMYIGVDKKTLFFNLI